MPRSSFLAQVPATPCMRNEMSETDGLPAAERSRVMFCILLGTLLGNLDAAIANVALPTIARDLQASDAATVWVVNGYQLTLAICLLPASAAGEILGQKAVYAFGLIVFGIGSLGCAVAPSLDFLIAARLLQGIGGSCTAALGPALIREIYPRSMLGQGLSLIALVVGVSSAIAPSIASLILSITTWPWLFLVNVPLCALAVPLFLASAPSSTRHPQPLDWLGAALNALALGFVVIGVDTLGTGEKLRAGMEIAIGLVALVLLILQQRRRPLLLPLDLMHIPLFALSFFTSSCAYAAQMLAYISLPFLFQSVLHRSQVATGLLITPWPLLVAVSAILAGRLTARYPASVLGSIGLVILAIGLLALAALPAAPSDLDIAWRMGLCGIGFGFFQTPNNLALLTSAPKERAGAAGGMLAVARTLGWSLGSALVACIFELESEKPTMTCLLVGAGFAFFGALVSSARLAGRGAVIGPSR